MDGPRSCLPVCFQLSKMSESFRASFTYSLQIICLIRESYVSEVSLTFKRLSDSLTNFRCLQASIDWEYFLAIKSTCDVQA